VHCAQRWSRSKGGKISKVRLAKPLNRNYKSSLVNFDMILYDLIEIRLAQLLSEHNVQHKAERPMAE
jgi:hypothetical protein